jgi:hypothetical protein
MVGQDSRVSVNIQSVYLASTLSGFLGDLLFGFDDAIRRFGSNANQILGVPGKETTLQDNVKQNLGLRYDLAIGREGQGMKVRKPMVSVECAGHPADAEDLPLLHDRMLWPPWNVEPLKSARWKVQASSFSKSIGDLNSTFVNASLIEIEQFGNLKPSLGVFFSTPEIRTPYSGKCYNCGDANPNRNHSMFTCTVDARWIPARAFSDSSYGLRSIFDSNPDPLDAIGPDPKGRLESAPNLYLSSSWSKALAVPWVGDLLNPSPSNRTMLDVIGQRCLDASTRLNATLMGRTFEDGLAHRINTNPQRMLECLQIGLSIGIAEAISRSQDNIPAYFVAEGHNLPVNTKINQLKPDVFLVADLRRDMPQHRPDITSNGWIRNVTKADLADTSRFTEIKMPIGRWGYGYGFHDSILIYFGVMLLLIHAIAALVYVVWIITRGEYEDAGWDSIGGLVNIAMKSGTKEEANAVDEPPTGSSKERNKFWRKKWRDRVAVRQAGRDDGNESTNDVSSNRDGVRSRTVMIRIEEFGKLKDLESNERRRRSSSDDRSERTTVE